MIAYYRSRPSIHNEMADYPSTATLKIILSTEIIFTPQNACLRSPNIAHGILNEILNSSIIKTSPLRMTKLKMHNQYKHTFPT